MKEIHTVLFLRKLPRYVRDLINPREFQEPEALIQQCNEIWEDRSDEEGAATSTSAASATATSRHHSPFRGTRRSSSLFRVKGPAGDKSGRRLSPTPGPPRDGGSDRWCFYHSHFGSKAKKCEKGCSCPEN